MANKIPRDKVVLKEHTILYRFWISLAALMDFTQASTSKHGSI